MKSFIAIAILTLGLMTGFLPCPVMLFFLANFKVSGNYVFYIATYVLVALAAGVGAGTRRSLGIHRGAGAARLEIGPSPHAH